MRQFKQRLLEIAVALALLVTVGYISYDLVVQARPATTIIIVHTSETKALQWNPATHEEAREELPDGNMRTIVRPKSNQSQ